MIPFTEKMALAEHDGCNTKFMMISLSELLRFEVIDSQGRKTRLRDLAGMILEDQPQITRLLWRQKKERFSLPWEAVRSVDLTTRQVTVHDLQQGISFSQCLAGESLLKDDVLDALIIDLPHRRTTRANDLWLEFEGKQLWIRGVDTTGQAIFRRLLRSKFGTDSQQSCTDWKQIEFLRGDPQATRDGSGYRRAITSLQPAEIAQLSEALPYLHAVELLILLPDPLAADVLEAMSDERELQVFEELDEEQGTRLLNLMAPDAAADLIGRLYPEQTKRYLERLPQLQRERLIELLRYPEDSVGGVMTNDVVFAPVSLTIGEAREQLRDRLKEPDFIYFIYVVEDEASRRLRGVLSLRKLLVAEAETPLAQVMRKDLMTLDPLASAASTAYQLLSSHLAALPVIAKDGRLLGIMTIDAAVALAAPNSWRAQAPKVFS